MPQPRPLRLVWRAVAALVVSLPAAAQTPAAPEHVVPSVIGTRRSSPIVVDGRLDETAWAAATPITQLRQNRPSEGAPATLATEIRILYDDDALYVGARMSEPLGRAGIRAPLARRDQLLAADGNNGSFNSLTTDKLAVVLDPYHNHLDEVWFEINPAGVRGDQFNGDPSWDPVWEGATQITADGWTAEMRIPYSQLRFSSKDVQTWGLQLWRFVDRLNEQDQWSFRRRNESSGPAYYGHLEGLAIAKVPRQAELLPYVVSREQFKYAEPGDPYHGTARTKLNAGADIKYNLTSSLTLDATINPDFGQVEVDPALLNLSAYEVAFDEKRPFFIANRSAFSFGGLSCINCNNTGSLSAFYSRRIGRPPQLNGLIAGSSVYADMPDNAAILGAAKITGRTPSGYTVGLMDAVTSKETARYLTTLGSPERTQTVEPLTNYFVGRVRKELRGGATTVGGIVTSAVRSLEGDTVLTNRLRDNATAVGMDWSHSWSNRVYRWRGTLMASDVHGSRQAMALTQRSPTHYFQRPDREVTSDGLFSTRYDTTATSMRGYGLYTRLAKENGNWIWELQQNWRSPGFEVNDLSIMSRVDYRWMNGNLARQWLTPGRFYRSAFLSYGGQTQYNYDGDRTDLEQYAFNSTEFNNYWVLRAYWSRSHNVLDDRLSRGGPVLGAVGYDYYQLGVSTDPRGRAVWNVQNGMSVGFDGTKSWSFTPGVAVKPAGNVFVQISPSWNWAQDAAQYVTTVKDPTAAAFSGSRYVFGYITTRTLSLDTRVNWTIRPEMTMQLYAQPFAASGNYERFREFAGPRTREKLEYGRDIGVITRSATTGQYTVDPDGAGPAAAFSFGDPNFTTRSLRGTAVLRWEYRPGSTMFFVWTQQRSGFDQFGDLDFRRDARALLGDRPDNVFLVKATYWLGR
ncbi:MAG: carbohydrate binding family 9 domain-containing protein [Gemmatimonadaceae bacterium]|nr:carbohydrate binding family 9 domain-containing protein [Gemmatimonadaceae bacterium]NUP71474.1 carbohydrate binding family 9 domain-containing protein [Gemmatimonadaceae bacterium]